MSIWTRTAKPTFAPHAVAGKNGWVHPVTGEVLEAFGNSDSFPTVATAACQSVKLLKGFVAASGEVIEETKTAFVTGDYIRFAARFNAVIHLVLTGGLPYITLEIDGDPVHAEYVSGSGTPTWIFQYRVTEDDSAASSDVDIVSPIQANSSGIKDEAGVTAIKTFTPPDLSDISIN